jgi:NAD(P)H-dependent FMN reductase
MSHIAIISSSVRINRVSHRVALFFERFIAEKYNVSAEILDLNEYNFPIFEERLSNQKNPSLKAIEFAGKIKNADGVIIVTPEYNGGYPSSIKNVTDFLYIDRHHKPVGISTVSNGPFGGSQVIISLQFSLWKMHAMVVPAMFPVPNADSTFDEYGNANDKVATEKRAVVFLDEFFWYIEAITMMNRQKIT